MYLYLSCVRAKTQHKAVCGIECGLGARNRVYVYYKKLIHELTDQCGVPVSCTEESVEEQEEADKGQENGGR